MDGFNLYYLLYGVLAFLPALIWLGTIFSKQKNKKIQVLIFLTGIFTVIPIFAIQILFQKFPELNFIQKVHDLIVNPHLQFILMYSWVGITEEIAKQFIVRFLDNKYSLIQTVNDSIRFSLISALGFSFAENIFYFYHIGTQLGVQSLLVAYLFRSIFTTCAHLVFSGFFGYYYGIAKFSISMVEQFDWQGKSLWFSRFIGRILNISRIQAYKESTIIKGLLIAIILHAAYDYLLELNNITGSPIFIILPALLIVFCYITLKLLLKNKAGKIILLNKSSNTNISTMAQTDEEVVIELLGLWFNKGKYVDVIHVCERLLKRDPENKIVKLFKAKALDQVSPNSPYKIILSKLFPNNDSTPTV